jgi:hypothetical protein
MGIGIRMGRMRNRERILLLTMDDERKVWGDLKRRMGEII